MNEKLAKKLRRAARKTCIDNDVPLVTAYRREKIGERSVEVPGRTKNGRDNLVRHVQVPLFRIVLAPCFRFIYQRIKKALQ